MKPSNSSAWALGLGLSLCALPGFQGAIASEANPASSGNTLEEIIVVGVKRGKADTELEAGIKPVRVLAADSAGLISLMPGGALVNNGAVSGQVQFRGLSGARIDVTVDGQRFGSGGPNLMDPAMQYAPPTLLASLDVARSVGSVSKGPGLAGSVNARYKTVDFSRGTSFTPSGDVTFIGRTADASTAIGGILGTSNEQFRVHLLGSTETGDNLDFPDGEIANTFHDRQVVGVGAGVRTSDGLHTLSFDFRRHETGETGNPPFAMDIEYIEGDFARVAYEGEFDGFRINFDFGSVDIGHGMTNYLSRPAPVMMKQRRTIADGETRTASARLTKPLRGGELRLGVDYEQNDHNVLITNPNDPDFFLNSLPNITMERSGLFAEWYRDSDTGGVEIGLRMDHVSAESGVATVGPGVPMMPGMLAMAFSMQDRTWDDTTVDAVLQSWRDINDQVTLRGTLARKNRAPGYVERFAWLPTPASGGLADGNTYVGDLELKPETALIADFGVDFRSSRLTARPTIFYRRIDDFIQGVPFDATVGVVDSTVEMVSSMNGDPTPLRFENVDARLFGADLDFSWMASDQVQVDGGLSWVRGERRDIKDNLYRIAPLRGRLGLTYHASTWYVSGEGEIAAEQTRVSVTNSEAPTDGYAIVNLFAGWTVNRNLFLNAGVENLLDEAYEDHLAGYNRIAGSDVAPGARLPGVGINGFVRLEYVF